MKIAITGSSGLIGSALVSALRRDGDEVLRLVRRAPRSADEMAWDPGAPHGGLDPAALRGVLEQCGRLAPTVGGAQHAHRHVRHA